MKQQQHEHLESLYPDTCRFDEIEKILSFVKEGNSCQMIGMPGVGRGNICKFLAYNHNIRIKHLGENQTAFHFVFVNFAEIKQRPLFDAIKFIFLELVTSLHERNLDDAFTKADAIFKKSLSYQDELVLFQGLKEVIDFLANEKNLTICLLFERFETYIPMLTDDFFIHLRSLRDHAKYKFSVVFSVNRPLEDSIEQSLMADFYEFFIDKNVYVTLADMPGILFRIAYLEKITQKKLSKKLIDSLLNATSGHGKLTRLAAEALLAKEVPKDTVTLDFLLQEKTIQAALQELWIFFTPSEQEMLLQFNPKNPLDTFSFLEKIGLLKKATIAIPLFTMFLAAKMITPPKGTIMFDANTNSIKQGNVVISEKLTSLEFKLLKYLLENPGKIIERDDIIAAVWKEQAATAGVTDQAVDQLLFRLRKKIEENPNNPQFIQTVKGRGIRFVA